MLSSSALSAAVYRSLLFYFWILGLSFSLLHCLYFLRQLDSSSFFFSSINHWLLPWENNRYLLEKTKMVCSSCYPGFIFLGEIVARGRQRSCMVKENLIGNQSTVQSWKFLFAHSRCKKIHKHRQPSMLTLIPTVILLSQAPCMSLDCGKMLEYPQRLWKLCTGRSQTGFEPTVRQQC